MHHYRLRKLPPRNTSAQMSRIRYKAFPSEKKMLDGQTAHPKTFHQMEYQPPARIMDPAQRANPGIKFMRRISHHKATVCLMPPSRNHDP